MVVRDHGAGDLRVAAYLAPASAPPASALRAFLRERLPEVMVPASFVALDRLPRTPNGKVDRRALPAAPDGEPPRGSTAARDEVEIRLGAIWREVLGKSHVGVTESFFDLGGHSLLAVRMMSEVERTFGVKIPLMALFQAQTVEALAQLVRDGAPPSGGWPAIVPIRAGGTRRPLFLIARPNVNALGYAALVRRLDPDQPVYCLQLRYPEEQDLGRPYTLEERGAWVSRYLELMRAVDPAGPYLLAGMCEGSLIAFDMARRIEAEGGEVALLAMIDTWPEENTGTPFWRLLHIYERALLNFLRADNDARLASLSRWGGSLFRILLGDARPPRENGRTDSQSAWAQRHFPGPGWRPPVVRCRIDVFRTEHQPYWRPRDRELGWGNRTRGGVEVHFVAGDHDTFLREEHVGGLAIQLAACLGAAGASEKIERTSGPRAPAPTDLPPRAPGSASRPSP